jgi:SAM-dependent methyltransferase
MQIDILPGHRFPPSARAPGPVLATSMRLRSFGLLLKSLWPHPKGERVVDLGAGHGMFSTMARRHGFHVTAVDARSRWTPGEAAGRVPVQPDPRNLEGIDWVQADVRDFDTGPFDIVLAIGLTYHLPLQAQLDLLAGTAGRPTVIDTEIFDAADPAAIACDRLRPVRQQGYEGALCRETGNLWSAADDQESFWPTHAAFLDMCRASGRRSVAVVEPGYRSRFGPRRWYVLDAPR